MKKKSISGSNIRLNQDIHFKGPKTEMKTKGEACIPVKKNQSTAPINAGLFTTMALGAIPMSLGNTSPSSMVLSALGAIGQAASISVTQDPVTAKFIIDYIQSALKVVNGAYAQNGSLSEEELKKLIMAMMAKILEKAGPGYTSWNQVLISLMQNATLEGFIKGAQSAICALIHDPVNANTGNFIYDKEDLSIRGRIPMSFRRFYNRLDKRQGCMGVGWRHNYEIQLLIEEDRYVILWNDGREEIYMKIEEGGIEPLFGCLCRLEIHEKGYSYLAQNGILYTFNLAGLLISAKDGDERGLTFLYNKQDKLISVSNGYHSTLQYQYDRASGNLVSVCDHTGRLITLTYELGRLRKVTNAEGETYQYDYDDDCTLSQIRNPRNICVLENKYDGKGRTILQTLADGGEIHYDYQEEESRTLVTQQDNKKVAYYHDERFRNVKTVYTDGEETFSYNEHNLMTQRVDKNGNKTKYAYDDRGNRTKVIYSDGSKHYMTYDVNNCLLMLSVNGVMKRKNSYDSKGNLLKTEDGLGRCWNYEYTDNGKVKKIVQADGSAYSMQYDDRGNITKIIDESGNTVEYFYDNCNRVIKTIDRNGNPISYQYDACDRIIGVVNAENKCRKYKYTKNGKIEKFVDFNGAVTVQTHNSMNQVTQILLPDGGKINLQYDRMQNVISQINPNGAETQFQYDILNRLNLVTLPNGGTIQYEYDANGNRISSIDANGGLTKLEYDERNQVIAVTDPANARTEYNYDLSGNLVKITNACGKSQTFVYNAMDQIISKTDIVGNIICYEYSELGKVSCVVDPMKRRITYDYYPGGLLKRVSYPNGHFEQFSYDKNKNLTRRENYRGEFVEFSYDCMNRIVRMQNSFGQKNSYAYDALGNVISIKDTLGNVTSYTYSLGGRLTSVLNAAGHRTEYAYDDAGKLVTICQHEGTVCLLENSEKAPLHSFAILGRNIHVTQYKRNSLGDIETIMDSIGLEEEYAYDLMGNMILKKDREGYETRYDYTLTGDIARITYADGRSVAFSYNPLRQLIKFQDWMGTTHLDLNDAGRAKKVIDHKDREIAYQWGKMGQREATVYPDGKRVCYEYDEFSRLSRLKDGEREIQYLYNEDGRLSEKCYSDGIITRQEYNQMGLLSSLTHLKNEELLDQYLFEYDSAGNKTGIHKNRTSKNTSLPIEQRSKLQEESGYYQYKYDCLNRLTEVKKDQKLINRYTYDAFGNRSQQETETGCINYYYNEMNQLIRREGVSQREIYQYDARGNLTAIFNGRETVCKYVYDETNRLSKTIGFKGQCAQYQYDGLGNRIGMQEYSNANQMEQIEIINQPKEVNFVLDLTKQYHNLLEKTVVADGDTTSQKYTWDDNVVFMEEGKNAHIYLLDELGSPVRLVEMGENRQTIYRYDEYGADLHGNQGIVQPFGFTGYLMDCISETYFAQAREYMAKLGRFGGKDIIKGNFKFPNTLNPYQYSRNNPINYVDHNGMAPDKVANPSDALDRSKYLYYDQEITDRAKAIEALRVYAQRYADENDFESNFEYPYFSNGSGNCANFVSQCLYAAGMDMSDEWYIDEKIPIPYKWGQKVYERLVGDTDPQNAIAYTGQEYSLTWTSAGKQYEYFSNPKNGYLDGTVIVINSIEEYDKLVGSGRIEAGDLLYWDEEGDGVINHATIVTGFDKNDILFAGNTRTRYNFGVRDPYSKYISSSPLGKAVLYFVPIKDSAYTSCKSSQ